MRIEIARQRRSAANLTFLAVALLTGCGSSAGSPEAPNHDGTGDGSDGVDDRRGDEVDDGLAEEIGDASDDDDDDGSMVEDGPDDGAGGPVGDGVDDPVEDDPFVVPEDAVQVATTGSDAHSCAQARDPATPKRNLMGPDGAIACLQAPGETLVIREGTYEEEINNHRDDAVPWPSGTSWEDALTVAAYPGEEVTIRGISIATDDVSHLWTVSYWIFRGLRVVATGGSHAIWTREPDHIRFVDIEATVENRLASCVQGGGRFIEFIDMEVHHCGDPGLERCGGACGAVYGFYWTGDDSLFHRVHVHDTTGYGMHVINSGCDDVSANCPDRNTVRYCRIHDTGTNQFSSAILLAMGEGNAAYGNLIHHNDAGIAVGYGAIDTRIQNNTVFANRYAGIDHGAGWGWRPDSGGLIQNNIVVDNGGHGISNSALGTPQGEPVGTVVQNNLLHGNAGDDGILDTGIDSIVGDNLVADPLFVDPEGVDLRLSACSPAIDVGLELPDIELDLDGLDRRQGDGQDLGAFEAAAGPRCDE